MSLLDKLDEFDKPKKEIKSISTTPKKKKPIKKAKITQDKDMNKDEIIPWLNNYITENKSLLTLDFLRSQKLILESIVEMRK